jgi:DNA-binding MarR family transcriptional regulator
VGLVDRAVAANLVERHSDSEDQRIVRLRLTSLGARRLRQLAGLHLDELRRMMPAIGSALFAEPVSAEPMSAEPTSTEYTDPEGAS